MWSLLFGARLTPSRRWVLAAGGCTAAANGVGFDRMGLPFTPQAERNGFKKGWNVGSVQDVRRTIAWLNESGHNKPFQQKCAQLRALGPAGVERVCSRMPVEEQKLVRFLVAHMDKAKDGHILAFDLERVIWVARKAVSARYFRPAEAWRIMIPAARRIQSTYASWDEFVRQYMLGAGFLGGGQPPSERDRETVKLLADPNCPWTQLDWRMDLSDLG